MKNMLFILFLISFILIGAGLVIVLKKPPFSRRKILGVRISIIVYAAAALQILITLSALCMLLLPAPTAEPVETSPATTAETTVPETVTTPSTEPRTLFHPLYSENPDLQITWEIQTEGAPADSYTRQDPICFELDSEYFALPGISTFRGNNYRDSAAYGTAVIEEESMEIAWSHTIGSLNKWAGLGWTGQPLLVQWDPDTRAIMTTMYPEKQAKDGLVEVICPALDGNIHFFDLEDGSRTRDPLFIGMNLKGTGALDPRGYPLLYVGSGLTRNGINPRMYIVSLIDGSVLYEYGHQDDFKLREWTAFDASPLVDAGSDTLIWPGESGVLYTIRLNTQYDPASGTVSVDPAPAVKTRYTSAHTREGRTPGYEASPVIVDHYLFTSENSGLFQCIDLNTMELIWAQDMQDNSNSTPLFQWGEDGAGYLYTASSLQWTVEDHEGSVFIRKLDASTGEILWEYERACVRYDDIAGGVQCSPVLGKEATRIGGLIIYAIGRTPSAFQGVLVALDTQTGEKIWEISSGNYTWSSPVALYTDDGHAYIFLANASGVARLIDGSTGEVLATLDFDETVEGSPAVFGNMLVIGSREGIYGIRIS